MECSFTLNTSLVLRMQLGIVTILGARYDIF
jgi:hypothetical protein